MDLTDDERAMIELEKSWWKYAAAKEQKVRELFGIGETVYYLRLNALIDRAEAEAFDAMTVRRLRRIRELRRSFRVGRTPRRVDQSTHLGI